MEQRLTGIRQQARITEAYEGDGATYQIWLEDSKSIAEKVKLISNINLQVWLSGNWDLKTVGYGDHHRESFLTVINYLNQR